MTQNERYAKLARLNNRADRIMQLLELATKNDDKDTIELCEVALRHIDEAVEAL